MGSPFPDSYRPDRLGLIMIVRLWKERRAYEIAPGGRAEPDEALLAELAAISERTGCIFHGAFPGGHLYVGPLELEPEFRLSQRQEQKG